LSTFHLKGLHLSFESLSPFYMKGLHLHSGDRELRLALEVSLSGKDG
jgi:hypothetical protein